MRKKAYSGSKWVVMELNSCLYFYTLMNSSMAVGLTWPVKFEK